MKLNNSGINIFEALKKYKEELIVCVVFMFFALGLNVYRVQSDGLLSYAFLERMLGVANPESSAMALKNACFFQSGCVYFNAPFYLAAYLAERLFNISIDFNGITLRQIAINIASNFYMLCSLLLAVKILRKLNFKYIVISVLSILFSTSAFAVAVVQPSFNHTVDIFIITLFVYVFLKNGKNPPVNAIWLGILCVMAILVRYLNFILVIPVILYLILIKKNKNALFFLAGFLGVAWIIPLILYVYNGTISPFYHTSIASATAKSLGIVPLLPKYMAKLLVHPLKGLFVWSPVTIFSVLGLIFSKTLKDRFRYVFIGILALFLVLYGYVFCWNGGWSFSNRYLVSLFPIYIIGLSAFLTRYGKKMILPVIIATIYSIVLFLNWHLCIIHPEFETPMDIVRVWAEGKSNTSVDTIVNVKVFLHRLWQMCRYKYILKVFV